MPQVPRTPTKIEPHTARAAIAGAAPDLTPCAVDILTAQWAHETNMGANQFNHNWGGEKATESQPYFESLTTEYENGEKVRVVAKFAAHESADEGVRYWISLLRRRYSAALSAAQSCDVRGFVAGLKARGYFTAPLAGYGEAVEIRLTQLGQLGVLGTSEAEKKTPLPWSELDRSRSERLAYTLLPVLRRGDAGEVVELWQRICNTFFEYDELIVDGVFGPLTDERTRTVQDVCKVPDDGIVGPVTWSAVP